MIAARRNSDGSIGWLRVDAIPDGFIEIPSAPSDSWIWPDGEIYPRPPNSSEELTIKKTAAISTINAECTHRILAKWPLEKQSSCWAGIYPVAVAQQCADDIAAMIAASNTACDAIEAATTIEEVEAVQPVWPVI